MNKKHNIQQEIQEQTRTAKGCFAWCIFIFLTLMISGLTIVTIDQYKKNKRHPNVISGIYDKEKKIVISDVNTKLERTVNYADYKQKKPDYVPDFETQIKHSKIGDTVIFVSPKYNKQLVFELNKKTNNGNRLYLNTDSIKARIKGGKQR